MPPVILNVSESSYVLPLMSEPTPFAGKRNAEFVDQSVAELLNSACINELDVAPYICSPLSVVENSSGKKRLVINLCHLNRFLSRNLSIRI